MCAIAISWIAPARPAFAQEGPHGEPAGRPVVAVLPLAAASASLRIYGKPVADALAGHLRGQVGQARGFDIQALSLDDPIPARIALVIDGRILAHPGEQISLEAQLRDPGRGVRLGQVATPPGALTAIDELAADLAARLAPLLARALDDDRESGATGESGRDRPGKEPASGEPGTRSTAAAMPVLVVLGAGGRVAKGAVPVEAAAARAGRQLARSLGYRARVAAGADKRTGPPPPDEAAAALRQAGASLGLVIAVHRMDFVWQGVLLARGQVRITLVDAGGRRLYDHIHRTDTLVGGRGDRHEVLVGYVLDQARDMAVPRLRRLLAGRE